MAESRVIRDYLDLNKPRITWLILMSTGIGYFFGLPAGASWLTPPERNVAIG